MFLTLYTIWLLDMMYHTTIIYFSPLSLFNPEEDSSPAHLIFILKPRDPITKNTNQSDRVKQSWSKNTPWMLRTNNKDHRSRTKNQFTVPVVSSVHWSGVEGH